MFERYTEKARRAIFFARYETSQMGGAMIEGEHLLLGLLREDRSLLERFFEVKSPEGIRARIEQATERRTPVATSVDLPLSHACKRALARAAQDATQLGHQHIGTDHLLLGLIEDEESLAARILRECGVHSEAVRNGIDATGNLSAPLYFGPEVGMRENPGTALAQSRRMARDTEKVLGAARQDANERHSLSIETWHLLLALLGNEALVKRFFPGSSGEIKQALLADPPLAMRETSIHIQHTQETARVLSFASEEAAALKYEFIYPDHLLLGLLREETCLAAKILRARGMSIERARESMPAPRASKEEEGR